MGPSLHQTQPPPQQTSSTTCASHSPNHERQAKQPNIPWVRVRTKPCLTDILLLRQPPVTSPNPIMRQGDDRRRSEERRPRGQYQYTADMLTSQVSSLVAGYKVPLSQMTL
eukprot:g64915.t1